MEKHLSDILKDVPEETVLDANDFLIHEKVRAFAIGQVMILNDIVSLIDTGTPVRQPFASNELNAAYEAIVKRLKK